MTREHGSVITDERLSRKAVVYVRQSTPEQVRDNGESTRVQLALREKAVALGWRHPVVIDDDLGISASGFAERPGFQSMLAKVATKEVGIILCVDASRLSRNSKDWAHLFELCGFFGTLIADIDQVYDMSHPNDRMVIGIKGTISEMELGLIRQRMRSGSDAKAARGELRTHLPIGYAYDVDDKVVFDPDQRVRAAVETMFKQFDRCTSVRQLAFWYGDTKTVFPSQSCGHTRTIRWEIPTSNILGKLLTHAFYAGVYVHGRRETIVEFKDGRLVKRITGPRPAEKAKVCIQDHHPGYITWEHFLEIRAKIAQNRPRWQMRENQGAIREGLALLVGLLRCGKCGRLVRISYKKDSALYYCDGGDEKGSKRCASFGSNLIDARVSDELCQALQPHAVQASIRAAEMRDAQRSQDIENASLQVGAMQYQADRALEQFDLCDPKNRHVADTLEERLNARLTDLESAKQRYQEIVDAKPAVSDHVCARLGALSQDFSKVWSHTMADPKLKKQLLRAAIQEIMVTPQEGQLEVTIHWQGDVHTQVYVKRPVRTAGQPLEPIEKLIRELAQQLSDEEIARILNLKKFETPGALRWTRDRVCNFRRQRKIKAAPKTTTQDTMTMSEIRKHLGISQSSVESLARLGAITTNQITEFAPWRVARTEVESERVQDLVRHLKRTGRLPKGGCRQTQPGLFDTGKALTTEIKKGAL